MAKIKLTKSAVDAAQPQDKAIELRDTVVRLSVQDHPGGPQGVHAPVPHECRRATQARLGPVRGTDGRSGTHDGAGVAGRGAQGATARPRAPARHRP